MFKKFVISIPFLLVIILCLCNNIVGFTRFRRTIKQINDSVFDNCHSVKTFFDSQNITIITLDEPLGNADSEYFIVILPFFFFYFFILCRHCFSGLREFLSRFAPLSFILSFRVLSGSNSFGFLKLNGCP